MPRHRCAVSVALASSLGMVGACNNASSSGTGGSGAITETTTSTTHTGGSGATGSGGMGAMGGGGSAGTGGQGAGGAGASVNGCTLAQATDKTSQSVVDLTWTLPHHQCILVASGTQVHWNGSFSTHPLAGGVVPTMDPSSPISLASAVGGQVSVTFSNAGEYPYFCEVHFASMDGVIYVQ